ncbi:MAG: signal peptidase II [Chloroflexus sp.]
MRAMRARWRLLILVATPTLILDQLSKIWLTNILLQSDQPISLLFNWIQLAYHENTGVAFGLFPDQGGILSVSAGLVLILLAYTYQHLLPTESRWVTIAVGLIFGGGVSNLLDRIRQGYVVDFIQLGWWPVFNLADSVISIGVAMLLFHLIFIGDEPAQAELEPVDDSLLNELLSRDPEMSLPPEPLNRNSESPS